MHLDGRLGVLHRLSGDSNTDTSLSSPVRGRLGAGPEESMNSGSLRRIREPPYPPAEHPTDCSALPTAAAEAGPYRSWRTPPTTLQAMNTASTPGRRCRGTATATGPNGEAGKNSSTPAVER